MGRGSEPHVCWRYVWLAHRQGEVALLPDSALGDVTGSMKPAMLGVFTSWRLANATSQGFSPDLPTCTGLPGALGKTFCDGQGAWVTPVGSRVGL